jgi:hypothetical protein
LSAGSLILILLVDLTVVFLAFFYGVRVAVAFHFPTRVIDAPALARADGSLANSPLGDQAETGIARIRMSPSNPGMREIKLSRAYIQTR